jgi:hypothetical protein
VLTLLFLVFVLLVFLSLVRALRRHRRAVAAQEEAMRRAAQDHVDRLPGDSPLPMMPLAGCSNR